MDNREPQETFRGTVGIKSAKYAIAKVFCETVISSVVSRDFRNIAVVSLSTIGSRLLGLLRDILIFAALGAGLWNSAFILAFTLPNLFRRLLGEGALTSAFVPTFSDVLERQGREAAFGFFNQALLRVCALLIGTVTAGIAILAALNGLGLLGVRWSLGADLAVLLLPYTIFICLAALVSAGLHVLGRFAAPALTPILLNLAIIGAILVGWGFDATTAGMVHILCGGVLVGGLLQLALPTLNWFKQGWRPRLSVESSEDLGRMWKLFLPGLIGAAILQVNIMVSRLLAYTLDESAVSVLYLASRLMELPLGVFTISIVTVFFPLLARAASAQDRASFTDAFNQGARLALAISVPAAVGLVLLADPILGLLFRWGAFEASDVAATVPLLAIYAIGLPFYSIATFATRGLHATKSMHTPARVAALCLLTNAVSGFVLMQSFGAAGLAAGNVLAAILQSLLLWRALVAREPRVGFPALRKALLQIALAATVMGLAVWLASTIHMTVAAKTESARISEALLVCIAAPGGAALYFATLGLLRFQDLTGLKALLLDKLARKRSQ